MPPAPQECQSLAAEVAALETIDQNLRAQLTALAGADAWAALAQLGKTRLDLGKKRAELTACIRAHSAALQANLVVMDLAPPGAQLPSRIAHLWEVGSSPPIPRESSTVSGNAFSFAGPLPARFGISVATTGMADVIGPDFRSSTIAVDSLNGPGPVRVEVVLGPEVRIDAADISRLVTSVFNPVSQRVGAVGGAMSAEVRLLGADASLTDGGIIGRARGDVQIQGAFAGLGGFAASATLSLVPSASPTAIDLCDVIVVTDLVLETTGLIGPISAVLPVIRDYLSGLLTEWLRAIVRSELPAAVARAFALPSLPPDVMLSVRRLRIDSTAVMFQPSLGAIGTTLSAFHSPVLPPP